MKYNDALNVLVETIRDDNQAPMILFGGPGIGKTKLVFDAAEILGWREPFVTHPVVVDPTYYAGLPIVNNGEAILSPIGVIKQVFALPDDEPCIFFADDVGHAMMATQNALMQLIHARELEGQKLPKGVRIVMASNRMQDKANVQHGWSTAFKTRFRAAITLDPDLESFLDWAVKKGGINQLVTSFLSINEDLLYEQEMNNTEAAHATPRTWEHLSNMLNSGHIPEHLEQEVYSGIVGLKAATGFLTFRKFWKNMPPLKDIANDPDGVEVPSNLNTKYAVINALARKADVDEPEALKNYMKYIARFQSEFIVMWTEMALRHNEAIQESEIFTDWCIQNQKILSSELTS